MAKVRLNQPYENHKAGEVIDLPATVARQLIHDGKATGGNLKPREKEEKPKKEAKKKK